MPNLATLHTCAHTYMHTGTYECTQIQKERASVTARKQGLGQATWGLPIHVEQSTAGSA